MPAVNPFIDGAAALHGAPSVPHVAGALVNPYQAQDTQVNAAGTTEAVAVHVAVVIAFALIGVYVLRASGFKFVVAGSVG